MLNRKFRIVLFLFMVVLSTFHSYHEKPGAYDVCIFLFALGVLTFIIDIYFVLKHYRLSVIYAQTLKPIASSNSTLYRVLLKAANLQDRNRIKKSIKLLQNSLTFCNNDNEKAVVHYFLGLAFSSKNQHHSAQSEFLSAIALDARFAEAHERLANSYFAESDYEKAEQYYMSAIILDSNLKNLSEIFAAIAKCHFEKNCPELAQEYAEKAFQINPKDELSSTLLAVHYGAEPENDLAGYYLTRAMKNGAKKKNILTGINNYLELKDVLPKLPSIIQELADASKTPSVHITYGGNGKSFIGGSLNEAPPLDADGNPMLLLCTLFCSEIPSEHLQSFPKSGVLRFYIADNDCYGLGDTPDSHYHKVLYSEEEDRFKPKLIDHHSEGSPILSPTPISFQAVDDVANVTDHRFYEYMNPLLEKYELPDFDNLPVRAQEFFESAKEQAKIFGYLFTTQDDPRPSEDSILLLQLSSDDEHVMFGDGGVAHFFISPEALAQQDFSKVQYSWDCY